MGCALEVESCDAVAASHDLWHRACASCGCKKRFRKKRCIHLVHGLASTARYYPFRTSPGFLRQLRVEVHGVLLGQHFGVAVAEYQSHPFQGTAISAARQAHTEFRSRQPAPQLSEWGVAVHHDHHPARRSSDVGWDWPCLGRISELVVLYGRTLPLLDLCDIWI